LWDPCLDVVGNRLPNVFVDRQSADSEREIAAVRALATGLGPSDGVLIYPEGTRFTPGKLARVMARIGERDPERHGRVRSLRRVLPIQLGGPSALLDAAGCDVVFLAHTGLDAAITLREVFAGALVGRRIRVAMWRVPVREIPRDRSAWSAWLDAQWARMDAWVVANAE
jgi:1-acyl-sn-glycerol-3-phosphate acyltransferase